MNPWSFSLTISSEARRLVQIERFLIQPGKINVLFGESGIGKSLIARSLFGLADQTRLGLRVNGERYEDYCKTARTQTFRKQGFFVFQEPSTHLNPAMTVQDQLHEADLAGLSGEEAILTALWQSDGWKP